MQLLKEYNYPSIKVPRIELAIWLMKYNKKYVKFFNNFSMEIELLNDGETMSEMECFNVLSGNVELSTLLLTLLSS